MRRVLKEQAKYQDKSGTEVEILKLYGDYVFYRFMNDNCMCANFAQFRQQYKIIEDCTYDVERIIGQTIEISGVRCVVNSATLLENVNGIVVNGSLLLSLGEFTDALK